MSLRNNFSEETRRLFFYNYSCFWCGLSSWDALHHILGRVSASPLNACPIHNSGCHLENHKLESFEARSALLKQTLQFLKDEGYVLNSEDRQFMKDYSNYYAN